MEATIATAEERVQTLDATLNDPSFYITRSQEASDLSEELDVAKAKVAKLYARWEELEAIKQKYATKGAIFDAPLLIADKARDMLRHYVTNILPNGYKAQVVAYSRLAAVRYVAAFEAVRAELAGGGMVPERADSGDKAGAEGSEEAFVDDGLAGQRLQFRRRPVAIGAFLALPFPHPPPVGHPLVATTIDGGPDVDDGERQIAEGPEETRRLRGHQAGRRFQPGGCMTEM